MAELDPRSSQFWYLAALAAALVLFGGLMSGLTLGLLSAEELDLAVIERSGTEVEQRRARKVKGLIKRQHLLLVTLLLCNAVAMEALPLVLDRLVSPIGAVLISVTAVLAFGEIIPQAVCKTYGLAVGSAAAPLVRCLLFVCLPIAWPIAKILDCVLGHDGGRFFHGDAMVAALDIHREHGHLSDDEAAVMQGALKMAQKRCRDCMTPLRRIASLDAEATLDEATMDWILETGHSRIPVHDHGEPGQLLGALLIKRIIKLRPEDATPLATLQLSPMAKVAADEQLYKLLDIFQRGHTHIAAIYPEDTVLGDCLAPPEGVDAIGIITLEDVIETLINEEIIDETDRFIHVEQEDAGTAEDYREGRISPEGAFKPKLVCAPTRSSLTPPNHTASDEAMSSSKPSAAPDSLSRFNSSPGNIGSAPSLARRRSTLAGLMDLAQARASLGVASWQPTSWRTREAVSRTITAASQQSDDASPRHSWAPASVRTVARTPLLESRQRTTSG